VYILCVKCRFCHTLCHLSVTSVHNCVTSCACVMRVLCVGLVRGNMPPRAPRPPRGPREQFFWINLEFKNLRGVLIVMWRTVVVNNFSEGPAGMHVCVWML